MSVPSSTTVKLGKARPTNQEFMSFCPFCRTPFKCSYRQGISERMDYQEYESWEDHPRCDSCNAPLPILLLEAEAATYDQAGLRFP